MITSPPLEGHNLQGGWCPDCGAICFYPGWTHPHNIRSANAAKSQPVKTEEKSSQQTVRPAEEY